MGDPRSGPVGYPAIRALDLERGAECMDCRRPFRPGDRYAERPIGFVDGTPLTEVVCLTCDYRDDSPVPS